MAEHLITIKERQPEINRPPLGYGVPLLDETRAISSWKTSDEAAMRPARRLSSALSRSWVPMPVSGRDKSEPEGYRTDDYRAPTPATQGARVVTTAEAEQLKGGGAIFIDVLPHAPRPANLPPWNDLAKSRGGPAAPAAGCRIWALAPVTELFASTSRA